MVQKFSVCQKFAKKVKSFFCAKKFSARQQVIVLRLRTGSSQLKRDVFAVEISQRSVAFFEMAECDGVCVLCVCMLFVCGRVCVHVCLCVCSGE